MGASKIGNCKAAVLSKGVERRAQAAASLCAALRERAAAIAAAFRNLLSPFLEPGESPFDLEPLVLLLVRAVERRRAELLESEDVHQTALARLAAARERRERAIAAVRAQMASFRDVGLRGRLPVVPPGPTPTQPQALLAAARLVAGRLKRPNLTLAPGIAAGIKLYPRLRTDFDGAVDELKTSIVEVGKLEGASTAARRRRNRAMAELDFRLATARQVAAALGGRPAASTGGKGGR